MTMTNSSEARRLAADDSPTRQTISVPFTIRSTREVRVERDGEEVELIRVEGHASVFDFEYEVYGGPPYGWIERVDRKAFDKTMSEDPDVVFLRNHVGMPLARTKSGTLELEIDDVGLFTRADLDPTNPEVQALVSALDRRDVDEMSFAFRTMAQMWSAHDDYPEDEMSLRELMEVNINRGDVSAVTFGASDGTDIDLVRSLATLNEARLDEVATAATRRLEAMRAGKPATGGGTPPDPETLALLGIPDNPLIANLLGSK